MTAIQLSQALADFDENLDEIRDALATNMKAELDALPPLPEEHRYWHEKLRALDVQEITEDRLRVIKRIEARKAYMHAPKNAATITDADIQRAKDVPMQELYGGKLRANSGLCPFHDEKTPSFHINKKKNKWKCFGCDTYGDSIDFVMKRDNLTFIEAVKNLINK